MSTHNIGFHGEIRKILSEYSQKDIIHKYTHLSGALYSDMNFSYFSMKNICCYYSLEMPS